MKLAGVFANKQLALGPQVAGAAPSNVIPPYCASCMAPAQVWREVKGERRVVGGRQTLTMSFPYCNACNERAATWVKRGTTTGLVALGVSALVTLIALAVTALSLEVLSVLALVASLASGIAAMLLLKPKAAPAPATTAAAAVYIKGFTPNAAVLFFTNRSFASSYAQANPQLLAYAGEGSHRVGFGISALIFGIFASLGCGVGFWHLSHPELYVDNPSATALTISADGKPLFTVAPNKYEHTRLARGEHELSYSYATGKVGSPTKVSLSMNDVHLFNPGKAACFSLDAVAYGKASTKDLEDGPLPVRDFYTFDKVDNWFTDNPRTIRTKASGETRIAIKLNRSCTDLASRGCAESVRARYAICQKKAYDRAALDTSFTTESQATFDAAMDACDGEAMNSCRRNSRTDKDGDAL